jgi:hypothetical protein
MAPASTDEKIAVNIDASPFLNTEGLQGINPEAQTNIH